MPFQTGTMARAIGGEEIHLTVVPHGRQESIGGFLGPTNPLTQRLFYPHPQTFPLFLSGHRKLGIQALEGSIRIRHLSATIDGTRRAGPR